MHVHVETCVETSVIQFNVRTFAPTSSAPSVAYPAQKKTPTKASWSKVSTRRSEREANKGDPSKVMLMQLLQGLVVALLFVLSRARK